MAQKAKHDKKYCTGCQKEKTLPNFYNCKPSKFNPDGKVGICKDCVKDMVNPDDLNSVLRVLRIIDRPFIKEIWEQSLKSKNNSFGDYLRKINSLHQYRDMTFEDGLTDTEAKMADIPTEESVKPSARKELVKKWGTGFTAEEYEYLEGKEADYKRSYEIVTANHKDLLHQICMLNVMCKRTMISDPDAYKKYSEMLDKLSKSAKFTEAQRTEADKTGGINSFGQMIEYIEKRGFIPKWHTEEPQDIVDNTINVINEYTNRLVLGESNLSNLVDASIEKMRGGEDFGDEIGEDIDESELDKDFEFDDLHYELEDDD